MNRLAVYVAVLGMAAVWPESASAQPLGTFRWQQLPYCNYSIRFDVTGLGFPAATPLLVATPMGMDPVFASVWVQTVIGGGGGVTAIGGQIMTRDAAGALVDAPLTVMLAVPDANTGSTIPPLEVLDPNVTRSCTTVGDETECTYTWRR
jgi:hypothetical protein